MAGDDEEQKDSLVTISAEKLMLTMSMNCRQNRKVRIHTNRLEAEGAADLGNGSDLTAIESSSLNKDKPVPCLWWSLRPAEAH